ncbi:putative ATP-dependent RNA helicase DHR1 [Araneus ventricosus]|uniref:Putative ATP-dependent RNA helicase DHR1 n=1 Tax=Araneus ventricosus TaxID=182803 RepID=A0A4Y2B5S0_ARAVE|nr:putative ATP-dependent RNA helicase DHR1 [Araneus ventricosus]
MFQYTTQKYICTKFVSYSVEPLNTEELQHQQSDNENDDSNEIIAKKVFENASPLYVLPLYSILPFKEQEKVFKPPPEGSRLCVVTTNIAETSITITGLKYVVDSGKVKSKVYNNTGGGISKFEIVWSSRHQLNRELGVVDVRKEDTATVQAYNQVSSQVPFGGLPSSQLDTNLQL